MHRRLLPNPKHRRRRLLPNPQHRRLQLVAAVVMGKKGKNRRQGAAEGGG